MMKKRTFIVTAIEGGTILAALFFGALVARGGWFLPSPLAPPISNNGILTATTTGQIKDGGLELNAVGLDAIGLYVYGGQGNGCNPAPGKYGEGCVGIGTNDPNEKLEIIGNLQLSGIIKPNGNAGADGHILTLLGPNGPMNWTGDGWMTIERVDIKTPQGWCVPLFPACPSGWTQPDPDIVINASCNASSKGWSYGNAIRICHRPF